MWFIQMTNFISIRQTAQPSGLLLLFNKPGSNSNPCLVYTYAQPCHVKNSIAALLEIKQPREDTKLKHHGCILYKQQIANVIFRIAVTTFRCSAT